MITARPPPMTAELPPMTAELLERTDGYVVAVWRRLMLLVWRGNASAAGIDRSRELFARWSASQPGGAVFVVVLPLQHTLPPDEASRAAMRRAASSPSRNLRGTATLVESEGFIASSVRSIMMALTTGRAPNVFRTTGELATWAATLLKDPELTAAGLAEAIRAAREG
ncbi:hypothetical protein [Sorangium atrum]|uniref:Uncharacterized protein n=1 Tax=Sorangium atrum TaxID=2995308 RepID=A0ABT5C7T9_9BACT|nr:hypothetical protein [Sorangium aterium]MDC0682460.1 hypothetical protein [Sorangium aterium]